MKKEILFYGLAGGLLILLLRLLEYRFLILEHSLEIYGGIIAAIFSAIGIYFGLKLTKKKEVIIVKERVSQDKPFTLDQRKLAELKITQREHEILQLMAKGLSNKEIGEQLFIGENTVKTHSSRLFDKLNAKRRMQAVETGRNMGIIP